jgi:large subunit ribosomal protein L25
MLTLDVSKRTLVGKASKDLLKKGEMPATIYGPKQEAVSISVPVRAFQKVWKQGGESTVVILKGLGDEKETLIHEVSFDPISDLPRHADFYAIEKGKKVRVGVPIEFVGVSGAVKELGGVLLKVMHELEIEVMPKDLPHVIEVDISPLTTLGSSISIEDLKLPAGVTVLNKPDEVVVMASEVKEEEEVVAPMDLSQIEVEKKGKKEEEGVEPA